ncbi:MAG: hypothetical protein DWQ47_04990 [Acidobacteria bacterium]|nr:MAG: hypothetical protein DWQ32_08540 [Acidobacteriota bacterium]REK01738.1 MAG: hypothetical protein DWQ38_04975 [Acidobacteriota bacterium]REK14694.1 MAG: hypothetical protein DWQ43_14230 [Acidobacteriota bacterium]REK45409.1 MAG: hypothetical protein DWQ47_04990 [Acidobacteriota bacterium]
MVVRLALERLPEFTCKAVEGIAFVARPLPKAAKALVNSTTPDLIIVSAAQGFASEEDLDVKFTVFEGENSEQRAKDKLAADLRVWPETIQAIVHEAAHCATYLIDSVTEGTTQRQAWEAGAVAAAREIVESTRLKGGLLKEWNRVNESFEDADLGGEYDETRLQDSSIEPPGGFFTNYGGHSPEEDIAETASWLAFLPFHKEFKLADIETLDIGFYPDLRPAYPSNTACEQLSATDTVTIPGGLAAVFTKMNFLVDLGLVTEDDFRSCIGTGKIGLQRAGSETGFEVFGGADRRIINEYKTGFTMLRKEDSVWIAGKNSITREGKEYPAILELSLRIEDDGYPRGLYEIVACKAFLNPTVERLLPDADASMHLWVQGVPSNSFCAFTALVLVTRARRGLLEGAVVLQRLIKLSVPPVPEKPDPPVIYTFVVR